MAAAKRFRQVSLGGSRCSQSSLQRIGQSSGVPDGEIEQLLAKLQEGHGCHDLRYLLIGLFCGIQYVSL